MEHLKKILYFFVYLKLFRLNLIEYYKFDHRWIYLTNFYPTNAKKVFPCFNVPSIRSTFILNLNLPSNFPFQVLAVSRPKIVTNTTLTLKTIKNVAVQNVAFAIFANFSSTRGIVDYRRNVRLHARRGMLTFTTFAKQKTIEVINVLSDTFGIEYPFKKLDVLAVPDYVPQTINHLGLIILSENSLLYDDENPSVIEEVKITKAISRACASMWLQNIVTPSTWGQAWIGESLVKYFEYFASSNKLHDSILIQQFVIEVFQQSLLQDSLGGEKTSIDRTASILKMLESMVGSENFTTRVQRYDKSK